MKYCKKAYDIGNEYYHLRWKQDKPNLCSSGIYYANGEQKINEFEVGKKKKQVGGAVPQMIKAPAYYLDFTKTIGGRPEVIRSEYDDARFLQDNKTTKDFNKNKNFKCVQPVWQEDCL